LGMVRDRLRPHYAAIGCACLLFSTLGLFGVPGETRRLVFDVLIGAGAVIAGLGDHLVLRRMLFPPRSDE